MWKLLHVKYPLFLSDFNKTSIFFTDFRKTSNIKLHQNPSNVSRGVPHGQTDGHAANSRLSQSCERAYKALRLTTQNVLVREYEHVTASPQWFPTRGRTGFEWKCSKTMTYTQAQYLRSKYGTCIIPLITSSEFELVSCALASLRTGYLDSPESRPHWPW